MSIPDGLEYPYDTAGIEELHPDGWRKIPVREVKIKELIPTQSDVDILRLLALYRGARAEADDYPHVVVHKGWKFLHDGHHRAVIAVLAGKEILPCRVVDAKGCDVSV